MDFGLAGSEGCAPGVAVATASLTIASAGPAAAGVAGATGAAAGDGAATGGAAAGAGLGGGAADDPGDNVPSEADMIRVTFLFPANGFLGGLSATRKTAALKKQNR